MSKKISKRDARRAALVASSVDIRSEKDLSKKVFSKELRPPVTPKNDFQKDVITSLEEDIVTAISSPAGTGKTFVSVSWAADQLKSGKVKKIYITRPSVAMGKTLGFLKGDMAEKFEPYIAEILKTLKERYGAGWYETNLKNGNIEMIPFEYVRGRSLEGIVIADEMQNATPDEMYTWLTRIEDETKVILLGDPNQSDIKGLNGMTFLEKFIKGDLVLEHLISILKTDSDSIVRGSLCKAVVKRKESFKGGFYED